MSRGRYAPSPTGELHLGNASTALLAWLFARAAGGRFVMRMEDLDRGRSRAHFADQALDDLCWLGIDWDEGPDIGGPHAPYLQSERGALYDEALRSLIRQDSLYPCFCTRRDMLAAASAPQEPGEERIYPGTCARLSAESARRRIDAGARHAWRFRVGDAESYGFDDGVHGRWTCGPPGDFVVARSDTGASYQLAVAVDDHAMAIEEVVRGDDLLTSTVRQRLLFGSLGWEPPRYGHVPLLMDGEGHRLSKRQQGITLRELRETGWSPEAIVGGLADLLGLADSSAPVPAASLVAGFDPVCLTRAPRGIEVDLDRWLSRPG